MVFFERPVNTLPRVQNYIIKNCHDKPSQYIKIDIPKNNIDSLIVKSEGILLFKNVEKPNIIFIQDLKKKVGPIRYKNNKKNIERSGNKSKKKVKNKNSDTKNIEPGKPKNISIFSKIAKKSLGHIKFIPLTSVIKRVLKRRATASTNKNEFVDNSAWLIIIQKLESIKLDWPLTTQMVNQCISTTVE